MGPWVVSMFVGPLGYPRGVLLVHVLVDQGIVALASDVPTWLTTVGLGWSAQ